MFGRFAVCTSFLCFEDFTVQWYEMSDSMRFHAKAAASSVRLPEPGETVTVKWPRLPKGRAKSVPPEQLRRWFGLSVEEFARTLGTDSETVRRWTRHPKLPNADTAPGRLLAVLQETRMFALLLYGPKHARAWFKDPSPIFGRPALQVLPERGPVPVRDLLLATLEGGYS
jgi:DNA-binding transcriptional regulator YiaG